MKKYFCGLCISFMLLSLHQPALGQSMAASAAKPPSAAAQTINDTRYVQDQPKVLDQDTLLFFNQVSRELDKKAQAKTVLVIVKSLKGVPVATAAQEQFEKNKLSSAQPNYN